MTAQKPYDEDLTYVHDRGHAGFAEGIAPGLLEALRRRGIKDGLVVDLGCGSGIWARHLVDAGFDVVGVDISAAMVKMARKRVPEAQFHVESFLKIKIPRARCVTALGEVLGYLLDETNSRKALVRQFKRVYDSLEFGGLFIFDLAEIGVSKNHPKSFSEGDDWACLVEYKHDDKREQLTRNIVTFRRVGELYRRSQESHRLQLYRAPDVAVLLREIGFTVRIVRKFGEYPLLPKRVGFLAGK